ncbi:Multicopper oxidase [Ceratobasidium sp. AG-Ba]|nr:Multicopper oxidase [Ceratobasidium sp. AG-Ba]
MGRALYSLLLGSLLVHVHAILRQYTLVVTHGNVAADGISRNAWLINGTTPGPSITADEGDQLSINVLNRGDEPITIHLNRIEQTGTMWSDGVPGITQYPISVGKSFTYNWTATQMGYYWYHSHHQIQVDDGLRGDIYIRPKADRANPFGYISSNSADISAMKAAEKNPFKLFIYDWKHKTSVEYMNEWKRTQVEPLCLDNILINGKGCAYPNNTNVFPYGGNPGAVLPEIFYTCHNTTTELETFQVNPAAKWAAFNVVNAASVWDLRVSIDNHTLYTFAADGSYIQPIQSEFIGVPIGERYTFFIKLDKPVTDYTVRVAASVLPQRLSGYAVLQYNTKAPVSTKWDGANTPTKVIKRAVYTTPTPKNQYMDYAGQPIGSAREVDTSQIKPYPANPPPKPAPSQQYVDVIMVVTSGNPGIHPPHPIHKHGVKAWFLGWGSGGFPYDTVAEAAAAGLPGLNLVDPQYRDTFVTPPGLGGQNWIAFRFKSSDPGPTFIHCHIDPHLAVGMAVLLMEGIDKWPIVPTYYLGQH